MFTGNSEIQSDQGTSQLGSVVVELLVPVDDPTFGTRRRCRRVRVRNEVNDARFSEALANATTHPRDGTEQPDGQGHRLLLASGTEARWHLSEPVHERHSSTVTAHAAEGGMTALQL